MNDPIQIVVVDGDHQREDFYRATYQLRDCVVGVVEGCLQTTREIVR